MLHLLKNNSNNNSYNKCDGVSIIIMLLIQDAPLTSEDTDEGGEDQEHTLRIREKRSFVMLRSSSRVDRYKGILTCYELIM